jgi:hypothetical protein
MRTIDKPFHAIVIASVVLHQAVVDYSRLGPDPVIELPAYAGTPDGSAQPGNTKTASPCTEGGNIYMPNMPDWDEAYLLLESCSTAAIADAQPDRISTR